MSTDHHLLSQVPRLEPLPDVKQATDAELVHLWHQHRNGMYGYMCACEYMRREFARRHGDPYATTHEG